MRVFVFVMIPIMILVGYLQSLETAATVCFDERGRVTYVSKGEVGAPNGMEGCVMTSMTYHELSEYRRLLSESL